MAEVEYFEAPFSEDKIKAAVWRYDKAKSLGPNDFNFVFIKKCWFILKQDIISFVKDFHRHAHLPKVITSSFLTLISKVAHPINLGEYRSICLVGSLYNILAKLLVAWLKRVIGGLISHCQSTFVPGRQLLDGFLVANKIVDKATKDKKECVLFKGNFEKVYDCVNWVFLRSMMNKMGFGRTWMRWMEACIFKCHLSILVSGSPTEDFEVERGLRQGDPLSLFFLVIVRKGLSCLIKKVVVAGDLKEFHVDEDTSMEIIQFIDNTLIMGEGGWKNLCSIKAILRGFDLVSGLG